MYTADDATTWHLHADLVIVGSGGGALVAAIAAARQGCRVSLHERTKELGGSLARGPGILPAAGTRLQRSSGVQDSIERFTDDIAAYAPHDPLSADRSRVAPLCQAMAELVDWLGETNVTQLQFLPRMVARGHAAPRLHGHASGTGAELTADLLRVVSRTSHVAVRTASVVEDLWADATGAVVGVAVREKRGPVNIAAGRVLLASGGFGANAELVAQHLPDLVDLPYAGVAGDLGDGLRWGIGCGAATERLDACCITPLSVAPGGFTVPDRLVREGGIFVNQAGQRFIDEGSDTLALVRAMLAQPGRVAYLVLDERIYRATREVDPYFARFVVPRAVRRGTDTADLARHFEIDAENLATTLDALRARGSTGVDAFGRTLDAAALVAPFYGIRIAPVRKRTLGGLRVNAHAQVLRPDASPVANLYACGGVVADVSIPGGRGGCPFGHETMASLALGWMAGRTAQPHDASKTTAD
jgi:fumarate reductase flavoprotein subunit